MIEYFAIWFLSILATIILLNGAMLEIRNPRKFWPMTWVAFIFILVGFWAIFSILWTIL